MFDFALDEFFRQLSLKVCQSPARAVPYKKSGRSPGRSLGLFPPLPKYLTTEPFVVHGFTGHKLRGDIWSRLPEISNRST